MVFDIVNRENTIQTLFREKPFKTSNTAEFGILMLDIFIDVLKFRIDI